MPALRQTFQASTVFALDFDEPAVHDLALRYEHEIEPSQNLAFVFPETFTEEPLGPVPLDGPAHPAAYRQPDPPVLTPVLHREQDEERPIESKTLAKDPAKLTGAPDALFRLQSGVRGPVRGRPACALFDGASSGRDGPPWCACAPGSHASASACDCSVEMYACP
jgi:hypothetical protein